DVAQVPIVHVQDAFDAHGARVDAQLIAVVDVVIHQCAQQVVCRGDSVEVPGEVEVDAFHRDHLSVTATGGPTFHAKDRSQGWFAQCDHRLGAHEVERISQPDGHGGLALTGGGGGGPGDQHEFSALPGFWKLLRVDLGHVVAVGNQGLVGDVDGLGDLSGGLQISGKCDVSLINSYHFSAVSSILA